MNSEIIDIDDDGPSVFRCWVVILLFLAAFWYGVIRLIIHCVENS